MKIHVISTINGKLDEGMRNIATHITRALSCEHNVTCSGLRDVVPIIIRSFRSDAVLIFARANRQVYWLARLLGKIQKNLWLVCVQKPDADFTALTAAVPLRIHYLSLLEEDLAEIHLRDGYRKEFFMPGICSDKFVPADVQTRRKLKAQYGFLPDIPLVLHVGHCSAGRGLEDFCRITKAQSVIVLSGIFEDSETAGTLDEYGIRIIRGYQEHIEDFYRMADVYFFPTRSTDYVISIPLSVMEALSCGVPVIGYREFGNLAKIPVEKNAVFILDETDDLDTAVEEAATQTKSRSLLKKTVAWEETARSIAALIGEAL